MKYRTFLFWLNCPRALDAYILCKYSGVWEVIQKDIERNLYYRKPAGLGEKLIHCSYFIKLGFLCLFDETFRNIVFYRLKGKKKYKALIFKLLFPQKKDCEIQSGGGGIGPGFVICHGHGTVILAERIGENFTCFQGVTVGKNPRNDSDRTMPIIGDNVTAYTNSVIAGPITIANDVKFAAGTVCMQDVSNNAVVYGNPCKVKYRD